MAKLTTGKCKRWKSVRAGIFAADTITVVSRGSIPSSMVYVPRIGTNFIVLHGLFGAASERVSGRLWGRLSNSEYYVPIEDGEFTLTAEAIQIATDGKYVSDTISIDVSIYSELFAEITAAPAHGVSLLAGEDDAEPWTED